MKQDIFDAVSKAGNRLADGSQSFRFDQSLFQPFAHDYTGKCIGNCIEEIFFSLNPLVIFADIHVNHPQSLTPEANGDAVMAVGSNTIVANLMTFV